MQPILEPVTFTTDDGKSLSGLIVTPASQSSRACVLHGATGVPKEFYIKFAKWLAAEKNTAVLIYDYRGFGGSMTGRLKDQSATMSDWGIKDQSAALDFLISRFPQAEIWAIGHSLGGLFLNAHKQSNKISRAFAVASGPNYWRENPWSFMPLVFNLWWLGGPVGTKLCGFFPGKYMGMGTNLPRDVYWQWRRWCLSREFCKADYGSAIPEPSSFKNPANIRIVSIEDDKIVTPAMVLKLKDYYAGAAIDCRQIDLKDVGVGKIGHIGAFREQNKKAWDLIVG